MPDPRSVDRIDTGVPGLDTILNGGLFKSGVYIVEGEPGSGKTIQGNQISGMTGCTVLLLSSTVVVADTFDRAEQILTGIARTVPDPETQR